VAFSEFSIPRFSVRSIAIMSVGWCCVGVAAACLPGCASSSPPSTRAENGRLIISGDRPRAAVVPNDTPATINGEPVSWRQLLPILSEAGGGVALEEITFDILLGRAAERAGVAVTPEDIKREETLLARTIGRTADADDETAARLLRDVRRARSLGSARYNALLRRTAILRRLVADEVNITNAAVEQMHAIRHGERFRARLITVNSESAAELALRRLREGEPFGEVAAALSTDASAARGGVIEPISPADPTYPSSLRAALKALEPGRLSPIVALDSGYAVLLLEERIEPDGVALGEVREELEQAVRLRQERMAMNAYAQRLLERADVVVFDPHLSQSWRHRRDR